MSLAAAMIKPDFASSGMISQGGFGVCLARSYRHPINRNHVAIEFAQIDGEASGGGAVKPLEFTVYRNAAS
jgi:hypothetical protein